MAKEIIPWVDEVKKTRKLTIALDESIGKLSWAKAFKNGIDRFNEFSTQTWKLGVTYEETANATTANVVAQAKVGGFRFGWSNDKHKLDEKDMKFDGESVHGLCSMLYGNVENPATKAIETRLVKAFIFVPGKPLTSGKGSRLIGEPVRLVIAVHEMIHACGLGDEHHTTDDVFSWPRSRFENEDPNDDRVEVYTGQRKEVIIAGQKRSAPVMASMPPIFLNKPTQDKIRALWTV